MSEFIHGQVGEEAEHAITNIRNEQGELDTGNVVRRACEWTKEASKKLGKPACQQMCQLRNEYDMFDNDPTAREFVHEAMDERACADMNLLGALQRLRLEPNEVLMVGVTANNVGFADRLDEYDVKENPYGWRELPGFNAFFARKREVGALGRRLADCADINFEFKDQDGNTVFGFEHGTRTNMRGSSAYEFEEDGEKMSFTEYVLREAIEHYGTDPNTIKIKLAAAIQAHNFIKHFDSREAMEEHLPGWLEAGFLTNDTTRTWELGDAITVDDTWLADTRGMIIHDIRQTMQELDIPAENFDAGSVLDPNESKGKFSSHETSKETGQDTRDLYITFLKQ